jgi:predicted transcriptional regulator
MMDINKDNLDTLSHEQLKAVVIISLCSTSNLSCPEDQLTKRVLSNFSISRANENVKRNFNIKINRAVAALLKSKIVKKYRTRVGSKRIKLSGLAPPEEIKPEPKIAIWKSVTPGHLFCLECGKKMQLLKKHLKKVHQTTPRKYNEKWGLSKDYPMVAKKYSNELRKRARENKKF